MNDSQVSAIGTLISALLGAIVGFWLSDRSARQREARLDYKQSESVRMLVRIEIDQNLTMLKEFWLKAIKADEQSMPGYPPKIRNARTLIDLPLTPFQRLVLQSQLPLLSIALNSEQVSKVLQFYDGLNRLEAVRGDLILADEAQDLSFRTASSTANGVGPSLAFRYLPDRPFDHKATAIWDECQGLVMDMLAAGNPLATAK